MTKRGKQPVSREMIQRLTVLMVLLATLTSVTGCQPASDPTEEESQEPKSGSGTLTSGIPQEQGPARARGGVSDGAHSGAVGIGRGGG